MQWSKLLCVIGVHRYVQASQNTADVQIGGYQCVRCKAWDMIRTTVHVPHYDYERGKE